MSVYLQFDSGARSEPFKPRNNLAATSPYTSVAAATTKDLNASHPDPSTLTGNVNGPLIVDGFQVPLNQRVLVKDQNDPTQNGLYSVTNTGTFNSMWTLTRTTDFAAGSAQPTTSFVRVEASSQINALTCWHLSAAVAAVDAVAANFEQACLWFPNDSRYFEGQKTQTPTNYRVFYRELNDCNNIRTIGYLAHCKERPLNLNFSVEFCVVTIPACALVQRPNGDVVSILDEPYIYVRLMPIEHAEGLLIYTNNQPGDGATFMVWCDRFQFGAEPASPPLTVADANDCPVPTISSQPRWIIYKSCMITIMRLDLCAQEWQIRLYDRYGNDLIIVENDNAGAGFEQATEPLPDPNRQTSVLVGIKPNYPL